MPLSVLEAMSTGLPVVSSAIGGLGEIIEDGHTGYIYPPGDIKSMVKAIMVGVFLTAVIQGLLGGIGFAIAGISSRRQSNCA